MLLANIKGLSVQRRRMTGDKENKHGGGMKGVGITQGKDRILLILEMN